MLFRSDAFEKLKQEALDAMEFVGLESATVRKGVEQAAKLVEIADRMVALGGKKVKAVARSAK